MIAAASDSPLPGPAPKLFDDGELYKVAEIAEKLKCGTDTVEREVKRRKLRAIRFGARKYLGSDLNRVVEAQWRGE